MTKLNVLNRDLDQIKQKIDRVMTEIETISDNHENIQARLRSYRSLRAFETTLTKQIERIK